jgi:hypothetical protein
VATALSMASHANRNVLLMQQLCLQVQNLGAQGGAAAVQGGRRCRQQPCKPSSGGCASRRRLWCRSSTSWSRRSTSRRAERVSWSAACAGGARQHVHQPRNPQPAGDSGAGQPGMGRSPILLGSGHVHRADPVLMPAWQPELLYVPRLAAEVVDTPTSFLTCACVYPALQAQAQPSLHLSLPSSAASSALPTPSSSPCRPGAASQGQVAPPPAPLPTKSRAAVAPHRRARSPGLAGGGSGSGGADALDAHTRRLARPQSH